ncbi:MAG: GDSL family lipase [Bacteroidales bacterium]|nr:GDSL family lipase [Bacteroidales bacterium]
MDWKRLLLTACLAFVCLLPLAAQKDFDAADGRITWVGRTLVQGGDVVFDWSGVYAIVEFYGNELKLRASDSGKDYFSVWLDRPDMTAEPDRTFCLSSRDTVVTVCEAPHVSHPVPHIAIIQKRTEGEQGCVTFHRFYAEDLRQARPPKERLLEFVGDSFTCGYGTLSHAATDPFTPETEDCNLTYAAVLARYFDADYRLVAHSGMGVARNYGDKFAGWYMPDRYLQTFDEQKKPLWDAKGRPAPAMSVIYLATNDVSGRKQPSREAFVSNYLRLIRSIKDNYGAEHPVLCIVPQGRDLMFDYIKAAMLACQMKNVSYMVLTGKVYDRREDLGASYHPNYQGQLKKAHAILPYISTITGWPMTGKVLR